MRLKAAAKSDPPDASRWTAELESGSRFAFGANWNAFLAGLSDERIEHAEASLKAMLEVENLDGKSFLDVGSGSGLFSLAARRLGARVTSFDYDPDSVSCTAELKRRFFDGDDSWTVEQASALDRKFLATLGTFDLVYSWGVLHHTGAMWDALSNVAGLVGSDGKLFIAIYNDQGRSSRLWTRIKRFYVKSPKPVKWAVLGATAIRLWGPTVVRDLLTGNPLRSWNAYGRDSAGRGMDPWRDMVDWVGGYPFEVAKPESIIEFFQGKGFLLQKLKTCGGGLGCNEFVFGRSAAG